MGPAGRTSGCLLVRILPLFSRFCCAWAVCVDTEGRIGEAPCGSICGRWLGLFPMAPVSCFGFCNPPTVRPAVPTV
uniref:Putative secreted protein n=1 Tax=Anopheles triannulatus TaxID=58253 RepID=A0A2M4B5L9_9DIPT